MIQSLEKLIAHLKESGVLKSLSVEGALRKIDRVNFVPEEAKDLAYKDVALATFQKQSISQPTTVVFMLELLNARERDRILDIGAGSGWVSCLLAEIVGSKGRVDAFEINFAVGRFGSKNVKRAKFKNINYRIGDAKSQWSKGALYDRIYAGAAFKTISFELLRSLKVGGIFVGPTQDGCVRKITRKGKTKFSAELYPGFRFVPFVEED